MIIAKELIYSFFYKLTGFKNCKLIIGNIKEQKAKEINFNGISCYGGFWQREGLLEKTLTIWL